LIKLHFKKGHIFGYGINLLLVSFVRMAQPAMVYTCSILIVINLLAARYKGELNDYWLGMSVSDYFMPKIF